MTAARSEVRACAKFVHVSPRKARLVVDHIRGRSVPEARTILAFMPRAATHDVEKVLRSAVANAESNPHRRWNGDELMIASVTVDEGPTLKRWKPRARGRASQILKRTCHITITLEPAVSPPGSTGTTGGKSGSIEQQPSRRLRARRKKAVA
jgi:large subunit ribosomal protein L22